MKTKVNPRRRPATAEDVRHAYSLGKTEAMTGALILVLYVLMDKYGAGPEDLKKFNDDFNYVVDSVANGYVNIEEFVTVLKEEYGVELKIVE